MCLYYLQKSWSRKKKYLGIKKYYCDLTQDDYSCLGFSVKCEKQCFFP